MTMGGVDNVLDERYIKQLTEGMEKLGNKFDTFSNDFSNRLTKIETMFTMFEKRTNDMSVKMDNVEQMASEAHQSVRSAHKRLDGVEAEVEQVSAVQAHEQRLDKLERLVSRVLFWVSTTIIGGLILGAITVLFNVSDIK